MSDYTNLGFEINAEDNASQKLQNILNLLNNINSAVAKTMTVGSGTNLTVSQNTNTQLAQQAKLAQQAQVAVSGLTNQELRYNSALLSVQNAEKSLATAQNNTLTAINRRAEAELKLKNAESQLVIARDNYNTATSNSVQAYERYLIALRNVEVAQNSLASRENAVTNAFIQEEKATNTLLKTQNSLSIASNNLNKSQQNLNDSTEEANTKTKKVNSSLSKSVITVTALVTITKKLTQALMSAVDESGDFVENLNLFAVTFGENYEETLNWALEFADNLGYASNEIVRFTGLFKQLATSIGIVEDTGTEMAQTLTQLGYDLASFYNISVESAFEKLQAGIFSGQTKPLRSLGLDVTYQTLDNLLKTSKEFSKYGLSSKQLDQSQKAMLRLIVVLQNATNSFGDVQKTIESLENQIRVFQGSIANLKLAVGDAFREPFAEALVYVNGLIKGITKLIRVFVPLSTYAEYAGNAMQQYADDTEDATEASTGNLLEVDKFRALESSDDTQLSITEPITAELEKQQQLYNDYLDSLGEIDTKVNQIAEGIKDWFVITDENGNFVALTDNAKILLTVLGTLIALPVATFFNNLVTTIMTTTVTFNALQTASIGLRTVGVLALVYAIVQLVTNWDNLNDTMKVVYIMIGILGVALIILSNETILKTFIGALKKASVSLLNGATSFNTATKSVLATNAAFIALGASIGLLIGGAMDELPTGIRVIAGTLFLLTGAALAAAYAFGALQSAWTLGVAAVGIVAGIVAISSAIDDVANKGQSLDFGFANGGITDANFIMTHENGIREWVGKQGNHTAVVNDTQMTTVMRNAVAQGVYEAMSYNNSQNNDTLHVVVNLDGQKIYENTEKHAKRNGKRFSLIS